ncbi:hypothetical protein [Actinomycetospora termitidis]|uniref:Integral membrane protein n=1 Tax=Actinomycetospora termitidis TaxID=3053470 RepID=A0ABT7M9X6_9PSEU|nr:hypothetical protein [Actinomycetospora sp. Odt1-22]MDL5157004.1 hypothetical protein [Actinomycetospora sp. Odt1-22]
MSARRLDPGDWGERPQPRKPRAPHRVVLRHRTEIELGTLLGALGFSLWLGSGSWPRLLVVALLLVTLLSVEVREMVLGQWRRIVMSRRLQQAFLELGICSRHRRLTPSVIDSSAMPGATVVRVWIPVGLTVDDLARQRHAIAETCFVDEVHVERRPGRTNTAEIILIHRTLGRRT